MHSQGLLLCVLYAFLYFPGLTCFSARYINLICILTCFSQAWYGSCNKNMMWIINDHTLHGFSLAFLCISMDFPNRILTRFWCITVPVSLCQPYLRAVYASLIRTVREIRNEKRFLIRYLNTFHSFSLSILILMIHWYSYDSEMRMQRIRKGMKYDNNK